VNKFIVIHTCGHQAAHGHSGSAAEAKQREAWLARQPCQACWRKQQAAAARAVTQALPPLEGSEEEVAWGETIRAKALAHNRAFLERMLQLSQTGSGEEALCETIAEAATTAMRELEECLLASWWIENRFGVLTYVEQCTLAAAAPQLEQEEESKP